MYSPNAFEESKLLEVVFIAGVNRKQASEIRKEECKEDDRPLKAEFFFSFPDRRDQISPSILDFVFPDALSVFYSEFDPKFYSVVLTNEKGIRSYVYVLKFYERVLIESEVRDQIEANANRLSTDDYSGEKAIYLPLALCIWSHLPQVDIFQSILVDLFSILKGSCAGLSSLNNNQLDALRNYQHCELLNHFLFLATVIKPGPFSKLRLNLRLRAVDVYFPNKFEIPPCETNLKILLDALETSVILKLWVSILTEKHIIILANSNLLLFAVCEALLSLIFPFKWLHTYIPVLSAHELDYLESPTPYIMGVNANYTDYEYLKALFPNHVICDVNSSQVFGSSVTSLPSFDEVKVRKKLSYLKHPEIYSIDEVKKRSGKDTISKLGIEDVLPERSLSQNLQCVFFRIFRTYLSGFRGYMKEKVFDSQVFLEDLPDEEHRDFWGKVINTVAFEYFILSDQYLDDSNIRLFENILSEYDRESIKLSTDRITQSLFSYSVNITDDIKDLLERILLNKKKPKSADPLIIDKYKILSQDYKTFVRLVKEKSESRDEGNFLKEDLKAMRFYSEDFYLFLEDTIYNEAFEKATDSLQVYKDKRTKELEALLNLFDYRKSPLKGNQTKPSGSLTANSPCKNLPTNTPMNPIYAYFSDFDNTDSFQFFLLAAFHLEESIHLKDIAFENYLRACLIDKASFPRTRFLLFLNLCDVKFLKDALKKACPSLMKKIIDYKLKKLTKVRYKSVTFEQTDDYFKRDNSSEEMEKKKRGNFLTTDYLPKVRLEEGVESRKTSSFMRKRSSVICELYDNRTNAGKIIETLKSEELKSKEKFMRSNVINNFTKVYSLDKDPLALVEELCIKLLTFLKVFPLSKYKPEMLNLKFLAELNASPIFLEVKALVAQLQKLSLSKVYSEKCKVCLWLNLFNFLVIFTVVFKKEVPGNYYEWYRFLKNSYFNIGGLDISLYEMQNGLLTRGQFSYHMYGEMLKFSESDPKRSLLSMGDTQEEDKSVNLYLNFAMCLPTASSTPLRVYFPSTLSAQLKANAQVYLAKNVNVDLDYNILSVSELILWHDPKFKENVDSYKEVICPEFLNFISESKLSLFSVKFEWTLSFAYCEEAEFS